MDCLNSSQLTGIITRLKNAPSIQTRRTRASRTKEKKLPEAIILLRRARRDLRPFPRLPPAMVQLRDIQGYGRRIQADSQICRETVYNIPDIGTTGRVKGTELALRFIDIHTIWLPDELANYRDHRGNPRKDFRDWIEILEKQQRLSRTSRTRHPGEVLD